MSPSEVADLLGCSAQHVRLLIRQGKIRATPVPTPGKKALSYRYEVSLKEAIRVADEYEALRREAKELGKRLQGWKRGRKRT